MQTHDGNTAELRFQNRRESPALISMNDSSAALPFRFPPIVGAFRSQKIGFGPVNAQRGSAPWIVAERSLHGMHLAAALPGLSRSAISMEAGASIRSLKPTSAPSAVKTDEITLITRIGFDPAGPAAGPSAVKTDEITLITWIGFDPVGPTSAPSAVKTDEITLITRIGFDPVGPTSAPSAVKTDEITLITRIGFDPVGPAAASSAVKTDEITLITWIGFDPAGPARALRASGRRASHLSGLPRSSGLSGLDRFDAPWPTT
jgi:hypothetical protein